jgi:hypothetical protein
MTANSASLSWGGKREKDTGTDCDSWWTWLDLSRIKEQCTPKLGMSETERAVGNLEKNKTKKKIYKIYLHSYKLLHTSALYGLSPKFINPPWMFSLSPR